MVFFENSGSSGWTIAPCIMNRIVRAFYKILAFLASDLPLFIKVSHEELKPTKQNIA